MPLRKCVWRHGRSTYVDMTPEEEAAFEASRGRRLARTVTPPNAAPLPEMPAPLEEPPEAYDAQTKHGIVRFEQKPQRMHDYWRAQVVQMDAASMPAITVNDQGDRRRAAREQVTGAVADINRLTAGDQFRYELALMVVNQNIEAMSDLKDAAAAAGLPVIEYAKRTIATHTARRRRAAQVYAIEERALREIDQAAGEEIEAVAERAVKDIRGET